MASLVARHLELVAFVPATRGLTVKAFSALAMEILRFSCRLQITQSPVWHGLPGRNWAAQAEMIAGRIAQILLDAQVQLRRNDGSMPER